MASAAGCLLARALATSAPVLLLDEPTRRWTWGTPCSCWRRCDRSPATGTAVVMVLHQLQEAAAVADRALLLAEGRTVGQGTVAEVIAPVRCGRSMAWT
jgi:iron complex transport system ATP-binding protein